MYCIRTVYYLLYPVSSHNTIIFFHKSTRIEPNDLDNHNNLSSNCSSNKVYHNGGGKWYALLSLLKPNFVCRYLTESNVNILLADKLIQDVADKNVCTKFEDIRSRTANTGVWIRYRVLRDGYEIMIEDDRGHL